MDVDLIDDQILLRDTTTRFIEMTCPLATVKELADGKGQLDSNYLRQAAALGWFAMLVPEELGGGNVSGNGVLDAAVIAYARGAKLQPGSFIGTNVLAMTLALEGSPDQQGAVLPSLLEGRASATWAATGPTGVGEPTAGVRADRRRNGYVLLGSKSLVQDASSAGWLLVTTLAEEGPTQFLVPAETPGMAVIGRDGLDLTRSFFDVVFDEVELPSSALVGRPGAATATIDRQLAVTCVLSAAESVGAMDRDLALAVQYAKDRTAFGRPIGSFQAIKHLLADTSLLLEMSKAVTFAAATAVGSEAEGATEMASIAKAFVGDSGIDLAQSCFQVFGGIGFTWEHDQHLYLRRLTTEAFLFGDPAWHRERLCHLAGL